MLENRATFCGAQKYLLFPCQTLPKERRLCSSASVASRRLAPGLRPPPLAHRIHVTTPPAVWALVEMRSPRAPATCHVKPMLTLARGLKAKQEPRRKKNLKAPLSLQLGIFGRNEDGRRVEFRELFRGWETRRTKPNLQIIGRKTAGIGGGGSGGNRGTGRRERVPWLPAPGMKAKRGR